MKTSIQRFALLLSLGAFSAGIDANPSAQLKLAGEGQVSWLFWNLYQVRLYSSDGHYQPERYPLALKVDYQRAIDREDLIEATRNEWQRLEVSWQRSWLQNLKRTWPSVKEGDQLLLRVDEQGNSQFFHNGTPIGELLDPAFAPAFLAIWLDPESRASDLRRHLRPYRHPQNPAQRQ